MGPLALSPPVFAIFAALIEARAGLHYESQDRALLAEKVSGPAIEAGFDALLDYYYYLRYDPGGEAALDALVDALVVHETYFFREESALRALVDHVLAPVIRSGARPRVWCAACATGEEPLTLAMLLDERDAAGTVDLVASDISAGALARARSGQHRLRAARALPEGAAGRWLEVEPDRVRVRPEVGRGIEWRRVNLIDAAAVAALGTFDAILCRNVLIYFADATARDVVASLASALRPEGHLLVGVSESLLRFGTQLRCEERAGTFFYRREAP